MIPRQKWTAHIFNLGLDPGWSTNVLTRIYDTAIRISHHCQNLTDQQLSFKPNGAWSIKEHLGHLIDLEDLHTGRLREFAEYKAELTGADMSNARTEAANHNEQSLESLMSDFKQGREEFVATYMSLDDQCHQHIAMHPRLKAAMKPVDLLFFVAEHDDHHITSMLEIKNKF